MATSIDEKPGANDTLSGVHEEDLPIIQSLAELQELHSQLNSLRSLLPRRLLAPITAALHPNGSTRFGANANNDSLSGKSRESLSPDYLFNELRRIAKDGVQEVERFKKSWHTESMEKLWESSKDMEAFDGGQGNDVWMTNYAEMLGKPDGNESQDPERGQTLEDEMEIDTKDDEGDPKGIVEEMSKQYPSLKATLEGENAEVKVKIRVGGMRFKAAKPDDSWIIQADTEGRSGDLQDAIVKQVNSRHRRGSLRYLMDMMASYTDVKTRPCTKCGKVIDAKFRFPYVRKDEEVKSEESEEKKLRWLAYHEDCI